MELLRFVGFNKLVLLPQHLFRDGPFFFGGGRIKNPEKNYLQKQKSPNKLFVDRNMKNKKFADWLIESYLI